MNSYSTADVRANLAEILNHVAYGKERVELKRRGKTIAVVVPIEDLRALEALEDEVDIREARKARVDVKKNGTVSWESIRPKRKAEIRAKAA